MWWLITVLIPLHDWRRWCYICRSGSMQLSTWKSVNKSLYTKIPTTAPCAEKYQMRLVFQGQNYTSVTNLVLLSHLCAAMKIDTSSAKTHSLLLWLILFCSFYARTLAYSISISVYNLNGDWLCCISLGCYSSEWGIILLQNWQYCYVYKRDLTLLV